ncbi:helix-turn-helix domain-containing protein [Pseudobdellovibrio exovorus]|uniref:Sigma-54 factor interaction domain-containing protein n=1 Tax=Pseudobdellovibrio exovorus JSS TaxID=1184267 RepID=M4VE99_9BACT|nr:helix-turn-helix domain-containing protein [Pseudobdellovibrio exovorus]AGH96366.1 hypothetical protein A11Q_2150 [Pseudobdellovibrio exovorus JSS]
MKYQYGSFEITSPVMLNVLESLHAQLDKSFFIIVGQDGSGKTTMMNYINRVAFGNVQENLFDEVMPPAGLDSAIVVTSKEMAYDVMKMFDRQKTCVVELPNLEDRKADIVGFANFFTEVLGLMNNSTAVKLTEKAAEKLLQYNWPGNFHELESTLEKAFFNALNGVEAKSVVEPEHIELNLQTKELEFTIGQKLDEIERKYILQTLYFVHQNRTRAAEILGISIRTLRNKINQYREEGYL